MACIKNDPVLSKKFYESLKLRASRKQQTDGFSELD
ncbi:unnamed protein product [uncultured bacterium]|nr:unnamed protein product [uncultured bacterium]